MFGAFGLVFKIGSVEIEAQLLPQSANLMPPACKSPVLVLTVLWEPLKLTSLTSVTLQELSCVSHLWLVLLSTLPYSVKNLEWIFLLTLGFGELHNSREASFPA